MLVILASREFIDLAVYARAPKQLLERDIAKLLRERGGNGLAINAMTRF